MGKYLLVYYGGKMEPDPKLAEKTMAAWMKWIGELGEAVVDPGAPTQPGTVVSSSGFKSAGAKPVGGYSILQAQSLDAAVRLAKGCPVLAVGGLVEVSPLLPM